MPTTTIDQPTINHMKNSDKRTPCFALFVRVTCDRKDNAFLTHNSNLLTLNFLLELEGCIFS